MSEDNTNPFLTATYQNILIMDLRQVNECYFHKDYKGSFEALKILYSDLLEKPRKDMEKSWKDFLNKLNNFKVADANKWNRDLRLNNFIINYLYQNIPEIKSKFIQVLEKHKLLNIDTGYPIKKHHFEELESAES